MNCWNNMKRSVGECAPAGKNASTPNGQAISTSEPPEIKENPS